MSYYRRGKFKNTARLLYTWQENLTTFSATKVPGKFVETLIVRGIGYRTFALKNDFLTGNTNPSFVESFRPVFTGQEFDNFQELSMVARFEFPCKRYLAVRAGHTRDMVLPVHDMVDCITRKKDRKLVVASDNKVLAANLTRKVHLYRMPSVYTGRGVRIKHVKPIRKAGKKDKQRGKAF